MCSSGLCDQRAEVTVTLGAKPVGRLDCQLANIYVVSRNERSQRVPYLITVSVNAPVISFSLEHETEHTCTQGREFGCEHGQCAEYGEICL